MPRRLLSWASIAIAFGLLSPLPVRAQSSEENLPPGARVRVTLAGETDPVRTRPRLIGRLAETRPEAIVLAVSNSETRELQRGTIVKLEWSIRPSRKRRGALIGFGVGFVALGALAAAGGSAGWCYDMGAAECVAGAAILALPIGVVGAIVSPGEQWANVPLGVRARATEARGAGLQLRLAPLVGRRSGLAVVASF